MTLIPEEMNIILAALKRSQLAYEGLAAAARSDGNRSLSLNHSNSAFVCLTMIALLEQHQTGSEALPLREPQFFFIIRVLKITANYTRDAAAEFRAAMNLQQAQMEEAFAAGCDAVAEKWTREGFSDRVGLIH